MLRKRGEVLDAALEASGVDADRMSKLKLVKRAMIDSVMRNLNTYSVRDTGKEQWGEGEFVNVLNKTAENIAVSDILSAGDIRQKVDVILKGIEDSESRSGNN